ncbi:hypothetical protein Tco_1418938 [Tanacetum coccineum]
MTTLKFADTYKMVTFLSKPTESDGSTGVVKTINGEVQLHALVDGKKIIISKESLRRDLKLEDEEGIDCLPNSTIFEQLALMGYEKISQKLTFYKPFFSPQWKFLIHTILQCLSPKTTAWNEFSSTMTSAIICLATNQKFNFSKYIFESMVRNLDNVSGKFLMYPRFVQVFLEQQLDDLSTHNIIYVAPSHTKKIFGNMRRIGKGFLVPQPSDPSDNVADETVHKELGDSLVRAATTASSLEAEQDSGNITKIQSKATPNESSSLGTTSGGGPRCQETMGDTIAQTRFENVSKLSNDSLLARGNSLQSDEDRLKLNELMELYTNLQKKVLGLEKTKTTQANEIASLKRRVKKLKQKKRSRTYGLKRLRKGRINAIDADDDITLVSVQDDADKEMFDVDALNGEEVFVVGQNENVVEEVVDATQVSTASITVTITTEEITLAQALNALKTSKPKVKGIVFQEPSESTTTTITGQGSIRHEGADDEEVSEGGIPRVIVYGYDGLPIQPVAPPSSDYIPGPEDPQTPPVPQNEDEREPMDTWVDPTEAVPEIAPMTVEEFNTRVTGLSELHEHDTQDLCALLEDAQDSRSRISQSRVDYRLHSECDLP